MIDVMKKRVKRPHALFDAARQAPPFTRRDDARDDVEGDQPLVGFILAIDVERDAGGAEKSFGLLCLALDARRILAAEPVRIFAIGRPNLALLSGHLVEKMNAPTLSTQHAPGPAAMLWACAAPSFLPAASLVWLRGRQAYEGDANRARVPWQEIGRAHA